MDNNPVILSFYESLIRKSEWDILSGSHWLNDSVISFYFEYLERRKFNSDPKVLFVSPEVTQCIKITPENEISIFLDPLNARSKQFVVFALNDNEQTEFSGGTHWSLLVLSKPDNIVAHYDSSAGSNRSQAEDFSEKILRYFGLPFKNYVEAFCLQQVNGYDCGIHVLCNAENIIKYAIKMNSIDGCNPISQEDVFNQRANMMDLITNLKNTNSNFK